VIATVLTVLSVVRLVRTTRPPTGKRRRIHAA
jgi:hypothetical protein